MNTIIQGLLGIGTATAVIVCLAFGNIYNISWLSFIGGSCIGIITMRWVQLEYPEKK